MSVWCVWCVVCAGGSLNVGFYGLFVTHARDIYMMIITRCELKVAQDERFSVSS